MKTSPVSTLPKALSIAGFDGSGGAGILADVKVFSALGCYGMATLTALTSQNTQGVTSIVSLEPAFVVEQLELILKDIGADAVKLGMLHRIEVMEALRQPLQRLHKTPIVLDPVMISKNGCPLIAQEAADYLKKHILPLCHVITPNCHEAEVLLDLKITDAQSQMVAAQELANLGVPMVILKGGHVGDGTCYDYVYFRDTSEGLWLEGKKIDTVNTHGTGCTFSAAITAYLALDFEPKAAFKKAKTYIQEAIEGGSHYKIGQGHGPVDHFYKLRSL